MRYVTCLSLAFLPILTVMPTNADIMTILPCQSDNITMKLQQLNGVYDVMSQEGISLVLKNVGKMACMLPQLPELKFRDKEEHQIAAERRTGRGLSPGPVLPPVIVGPGQEFQIILRWLTNSNADENDCVQPALVSLQLSGGMLTAPFDYTMCTPKGQTGYYSQSLTGVP